MVDKLIVSEEKEGLILSLLRRNLGERLYKFSSNKERINLLGFDKYKWSLFVSYFIKGRSGEYKTLHLTNGDVLTFKDGEPLIMDEVSTNIAKEASTEKAPEEEMKIDNNILYNFKYLQRDLIAFSLLTKRADKEDSKTKYILSLDVDGLKVIEVAEVPAPYMAYFTKREYSEMALEIFKEEIMELLVLRLGDSLVI